jgi:peroxiredoxin Q/BCP
VVLGVSPDTPKKHAKFKEKYNLPYALIADTDHAICQAYGVWAQKSMFGKKYWGVNRTTFIVDAKGRIAKVFEKVNPLGHAEEVAAAIAEISRRS